MDPVPFPRGKRAPTSKSKSSSWKRDKAGKKKKNFGAALALAGSSTMSSIGAMKKASFKIEPLNFGSITKGVRSLAVVKSVRDVSVLLSLPGRMAASMNYDDISTQYSQMYEAMALNDNMNEEFRPLKELFSEGDCIIVYIKATKTRDHHTFVSATMDPQFVNSNYLSTQLKAGMILPGSIKSIEDKVYRIDFGLKDVTASLNKDKLEEFHKIYRRKSIGVGEVYLFKLESVKLTDKKAFVKVSINPNIVNGFNMDNDLLDLPYELLLPGMLSEVVIKDTCPYGLKVHFYGHEGFVHEDQLCSRWESYKDYKVGSKIRGRILYTLTSGNVPYVTLKNIAPFGPPKIKKKDVFFEESIQKCKIFRVEPRGITVKLPKGRKGLVPIAKVSDDMAITLDKIVESYKIGSDHKCKVLQYNNFDDLFVCTLKQSFLSGKIFTRDDIKPGAIVHCKIQKWFPEGAIVTLYDKFKGFIFTEHFGNRRALLKPQIVHPVGSLVQSIVIKVDPSRKRTHLSANTKLIKSFKTLTDYSNLQVGMVVNGIITKVDFPGLYVVLVGGYSGFVPASKTAKKGPAPLSEIYAKGDFLKLKVEEVTKDPLSLILGIWSKSDKLETEASPQASEKSDDKPNGKKLKRKRIEEDSLPKKKSKKTTKTAHVKEENVSGDHTLKTFPSCLHISEAFGGDPTVGEFSFWEDAKEDHHSKAENEEEKNCQNLTGTEELSETVNAENKEVYEKLVLSSPNNPLVWISYMAHMIKINNVDSARSIGRRALSVINFRDEEAKKKIWESLIFLEYNYGSEESCEKIFQESVQCNDPASMYKAMIQCYGKDGKIEEAEKLFRKLTKKKPGDPSVWIDYGNFLYSKGLSEKARKVLGDCLRSVNMKSSVEVVTKFAMNELKNGDASKGRSMFDKILQQYPKRNDVWCVYSQNLVSLKDIDGARSVFKRACSSDLNAKKMAKVAKEYIKFEEAHGNADTMKDCQQTISRYISNIPKDTK